MTSLLVCPSSYTSLCGCGLAQRLLCLLLGCQMQNEINMLYQSPSFCILFPLNHFLQYPCTITDDHEFKLIPFSGSIYRARHICELVAATHVHLNRNKFYMKNQSAYRFGHSVDTALLSITDSMTVLIQVMVSLSPCWIYHWHLTPNIYPTKFFWNTRSGFVLDCVLNYRSTLFEVKCGLHSSKCQDSKYGVPQGNVLRLLLHTMYTAS